MNKSEFLQHLRDLVGENRVEEALDLLFANIKDFAAYFSNDVVMLKSQFVSAKSQFLLKGVIENAEFGRITARVNSAILEIADKIEKQVDTLQNQRKGHLLHKIPSRMVKEKETKCIIRIAYFLEQLLVGLTIDEDTIFQVIQVTGLMSVELLDDNEEKTFEIRTSTDEEQFIIFEDCTQWIFKVRPLKVGCFPLLLKIGAVELINGKERKRNIIIEKEIKITVEIPPVDELDFTVVSLEDKKYIKDIREKKEKKNQELQKLEQLEKERLAAIDEAKRKAEDKHEQKKKKEEDKKIKLEAKKQRREAEGWNKHKRWYPHHPGREIVDLDLDHFPDPRRMPNQDMEPKARHRDGSSCFEILLSFIIIFFIFYFFFKSMF